MKYKKRKFVPKECLHVYQRTVRGVNIFYEPEDRIVFYTIFSVLAKVYDVRILELCLMIDHIHVLLSAESMADISAYIRHYSSLFVREYNQSVGRQGPLFFKSFGSAPKIGSKKIRSAIVYIGNNPVEKKLCSSAEQYRWNFLAYLKDTNPYSSSVRLSRCSMKMRRAMKIVKGSYTRNEYLSYACVRGLFEGLDDSEREQLTDYILSLFNPLDKESLLSFYETYDDMVHAMRSTVGGEYDIKEVFHAGSDVIYDEMAEFVSKEYHISPVRKVTVLPDEVRLEIAAQLRIRFSASVYQISKFLHLTKLWEVK